MDDERVDGVLENELVRLRQEQRADVKRWNQANTEAQALIKAMQWTLDNIYTIARREANRVSPHPKWAHVLRLCEKVGCQPRGVLRG